MLAYAFVIAHQILLGVFVVVLLASLYFLWRFVVALERIADGLQRIARQRDPEE